MALQIEGNDNYGRPRQDYADLLAAMSDEEFGRQAEEAIWLSAYANNNPRSDFHWHADACWAEARRREKPDLYSQAHQRASATA